MIHHHLHRPLVALALLALLVACSDDGGSTDGSPDASNAADTGAQEDAGVDASGDATTDTGEAPREHEQVITADWLNQTLTLLDYGRLTRGEEEPVRGIVDLSRYAPGPLQVEVAPGGAVAVVSVGPGFFDGALGALVGALEGAVVPGGTLLIVDLDAKVVRAELETRHVPMGIAISPDGTRAYTANFGTADARGDSMSVIDLTTDTILTEVTVGGGPEQVALSEDGTRGLINLAGGGGVVAFSTEDVAGSLSATIATGRDPSDLAFMGAGRAVVANSQSFDAVLVDLNEEVVVGTLSLAGGGFPYGVDRVPGTSRVVLTGAGGVSTLTVAEVSGDTLSVVGAPIELQGGGFPLNAAVSSDGRFAFVPHASDGGLSIVDLDSGEVRLYGWVEQTGPTYVTLD